MSYWKSTVFLKTFCQKTVNLLQKMEFGCKRKSKKVPLLTCPVPLRECLEWGWLQWANDWGVFLLLSGLFDSLLSSQALSAWSLTWFLHMLSPPRKWDFCMVTKSKLSGLPKAYLAQNRHNIFVCLFLSFFLFPKYYGDTNVFGYMCQFSYAWVRVYVCLSLLPSPTCLISPEFYFPLCTCMLIG